MGLTFIAPFSKNNNLKFRNEVIPVLTLPIFLFTVLVLIHKTDQNYKIKEFKVEFEQFSLDNGLHVIMHIDRSDPVGCLN
jgi:zinc protease